MNQLAKSIAPPRHPTPCSKNAPNTKNSTGKGVYVPSTSSRSTIHEFGERLLGCVIHKILQKIEIPICER